MKNVAVYFTLLSVGAAGGVIGGSTLAEAAPGDLIVHSRNDVVEITPAQAAIAADWFITMGAWDGGRADIMGCSVYKGHVGERKAVFAKCEGAKIIPVADIPIDGSVAVIGRVEAE